SFDAGDTWTPRPIPIPANSVRGVGFSSVAFNNLGRAVYVHEVQFNTNTYIASAVSTDGGRTWVASNVTAINDNGDFSPHIPPGPAVGGGYAFYCPWTTSNLAIMASTSSDGIAWSPPSQVSDPATGFSTNSVIAANSAGILYCTWENFGTP